MSGQLVEFTQGQGTSESPALGVGVHITPCHFFATGNGNNCICPPVPDSNLTSHRRHGGRHPLFLPSFASGSSSGPARFKQRMDKLWSTTRSRCMFTQSPGGRRGRLPSAPQPYQLTQTFRHIPLPVVRVYRCGPLSFMATTKERELGYRTPKTSPLRYDGYLLIPDTVI